MLPAVMYIKDHQHGAGPARLSHGTRTTSLSTICRGPKALDSKNLDRSKHAAEVD